MVLLTEILKGSSSSTSTHDRSHDYDVFLSFRGADTRNGFTYHLYNALQDAGVVTFFDDDGIETGEPLKPELESAIQLSRASVIVLSKNYASSTWCLDELLLILDQRRNSNHIVIPIFYHVEPTNVRKQQSSFGDAMTRMHKEKMETEIDADKRNQWDQKMESWKIALKEVADLKGKSATGRKESELIEEVVTDIRRRLRVLLSNTLPLLIGMDRYIQLISSWLTDGSHHSFDFLTIVGIGGIGKTSLAKYVYQLHSSKFHKSSFIEGINTRCSERVNGLLDLQKQLHRDITKKMNLHINDTSVYTSMIENVLARKRVFIVLDDIGSLDQLDALLGNKGLHPGSKLIITSKDASLTNKCALFKPQVHPHYEEILLNGLCESSSLTLLCMNAFHSPNPKEGYEEVSKKLLKYCHGHPLAIKVLGRLLQNEDEAYWEEYIKLLEKEPSSYINTALKISFDALPFENDKDLFKHIACFFVGMDRDVTETILDACGINTKIGIRNLVDRSLLSIESDNELAMHPLIQTMGRDLVRQESPMKPWKRSRLWFCMHGSPLKSIPLDLPMDNLVALDMSYSNIESFDISCSNPQPPAKRQKILKKNQPLQASSKLLNQQRLHRSNVNKRHTTRSVIGVSCLPMAQKRISELHIGVASGPLEVRVLRRWIPYFKEKERMTDLCYVFVDAHGDAIDAITNVTNAEHFDSIIKVQECYIVEKYVIFPQRQYMPSVPHPASLRFGKRATFVPSSNQNIPTYYYSFASYHDLPPRLKLPKLLTDYVGFVEHVTPITPKGGRNLRKVTILDESCNQIEVTLWAEKAELIQTEDIIGQIFVITSAVVTEFNNIQLESTISSTIALNPTVPEVRVIADRLRQLPPGNLITIADLNEKSKNKIVGQFTCTAKIITMHEHRQWFYAKCPNCSKRACLDYDKFVCLEEDIEKEPLFMYCLSATVEDDTDKTEMVFFNEALTDIVGTSCRDMVVSHRYMDAKTIPPEIRAKKGEPKLLHVSVKKNGSIAVNKAENPPKIHPATPDPKKSMTKRNMPQSTDWNKKLKNKEQVF